MHVLKRTSCRSLVDRGQFRWPTVQGPCIRELQDSVPRLHVVGNLGASPNQMPIHQGYGRQDVKELYNPVSEAAGQEGLTGRLGLLLEVLHSKSAWY